MARARTGTQPGAGGKSSIRGGKARTVTQAAAGAGLTKSFGKMTSKFPNPVNRQGFAWKGTGRRNPAK